MAERKTVAERRPIFHRDMPPLSEYAGSHVVADVDGHLWRVSPGMGVAVPVTIVRPANPAKPTSARAK